MNAKTQNNLLWVGGLILIALGAVYFSFVEAPVQTQKIGVLTGEEGEQSFLYERALSTLNEQRGEDQLPLELVYFTGTCDGENLRTDVDTFLANSGAEILVGSVCEVNDIVVSEVAQEHGLTLISDAVLEGEDQAYGDTTFVVREAQEDVGAFLAAHEALDGSARATVLYEQTEVSESVATNFLDAYQGWYAFDTFFVPGETDSASLAATVRSVNPDTILIISEDQDAGAEILSAVQDLGLNTVVYGTESFVNPVVVSENAAVYEEGLFVTQAAASEEVFSQLFSASMDETGMAVSVDQLIAYESIVLAAETVAAEDANDFLMNLSGWTGVVGPISFDEARVATLPLTIVQVVGGQFVLPTQE